MRTHLHGYFIGIAKRLRANFALLTGGFIAFSSALCPAAGAPELVHLSDGDHCSVVATYRKERIGLAEVNAHRGNLIRDNVKFSTEGGSQCLTIRALSGVVQFDSEALGGFSGDLQASNQLSCCFCNRRGILDLSVSARNTASLTLNLPGGTSASLAPGATAKLDTLSDHTYTFSGHGGVQVVTPDGKHLALETDAAFIVGGPVREIRDADGSKRVEHLSPVIDFRIGTLGAAGLSLKIGNQDFQLPPSVEQDFAFPNGASVRCSHDPLTGSLSWQIVKGNFSITVDGVPGWSVVGLSDDRGVMHWNAFSRMVDFSNNSSDPIAVHLPAGLLGLVDGRFNLHYEAMGDDGSPGPSGARSLGFSLTAPTGGARVFDRSHHKSHEISSQNLLFVVTFDGKDPGLLLADAQDGFTLGENVRFTSEGGFQTVVFKANASVIKLQADSIAGLSAELQQSNEAACTFFTSGRILDITTSTNNPVGLTLRLPDGGSASLTPGSSARLDVFDDAAYTMTGRGRIDAANGDGQTILLVQHSVPVTGGALRSSTDAAGVKRTQRGSPKTLLHIAGWDRDVLRLSIGGVDYKLPPGPEKEFTLPNGSILRFSQDPAAGLFSWKVTKGLFLISVDGVPLWTAYALSGQGGEMHWDLKSKMVDLRNNSSETIRVSLPAHTVAMVGPASSFHYSAADDLAIGGAAAVHAYSTAATGRVQVDNLIGHKSYDVVAQNLFFIDGFPERRTTAVERIRVYSSWDNGVPLDFIMGTNHATLQPGSRRLVDYDKDHRIEFIYSEGGSLVVTAVEGSYRLILQRANGMVVDVDEGDRVTLTLDYKKGTFVMITSAENSTIVAIKTDSGGQRVVPPDHSLNFRIAADGTVTASDSGQGGGIFLLDAPGVSLGAGGTGSGSDAPGASSRFSGTANPGGAFGTLPNPPIGGLSGKSDPSRIGERPVTP